MDILRKISGFVGAGSIVLGTIFLVLTVAAPSGLISAYPEVPAEVIAGPLGRSQPMPPISALYREEDEADDAYFPRMVSSVSAGFVHYWPAEEPSYVGVSILDNWVLWLMSHADAFAVFSSYEFSSPEKALGRGYGFCSQVSYAIYMILRAQGYDAHVLMHPNHVVVEVDGNILDGDYGVLIPRSASWLQSNPAAAAQFYPGDRQATLAGIYADGWRERTDHLAFQTYQRFERTTDALKWVPGLLLLAFGISTWLAHRHPSGKNLANGNSRQVL